MSLYKRLLKRKLSKEKKAQKIKKNVLTPLTLTPPACLGYWPWQSKKGIIYDSPIAGVRTRIAPKWLSALPIPPKISASRGRGNPGPRSRCTFRHPTFRHPTPGLPGGRRRRHGQAETSQISAIVRHRQADGEQRRHGHAPSKDVGYRLLLRRTLEGFTGSSFLQDLAQSQSKV